MKQHSWSIWLAITAIGACSVEVDAGLAEPNSAGNSGAGGVVGASGGAGATMAQTGGMGGAVDASGGVGATMVQPGGMDGAAPEPDASTTDPEGSAPDYGKLMIRPDVSTTPVASCAGQPDMTLCSVTTTPDRAYDICVREACVSPGCGDQSCNAPGPHFRIPPLFHHPALELQPGDEPVTIDLITGLHWQACAGGQTGADCTGGMAQMMSWSESLAYCDGLTWRGHDDWYLPDPYELISIIDVDQPADRYVLESEAAFPNSVNASVYWTSATTGPANEALAITSHRDSGQLVTRQDKGTVVFARCTRRGFSTATSPAGARYERSTGPLTPVFTDRATSLVWPSCLARIPDATSCDDLMDKASTSNLTERCAQLDWGGSTAWRVPTFKELHSFIHYQTDGALGESQLDESVVTPSGQFLLTDDGNLFAVDGRRVVVPLNGTYPYLCVRGPISISESD